MSERVWLHGDPGPAAADPILAVCGVPAAALLARIKSHRAAMLAPPEPPAPPPVEAAPPPRLWRLADLRGDRPGFVRTAHLAMLGRPASEAEVALRLDQLGRGRTRLGILLRLVLSAEGRALRQAPVTGLALPALRRLAPFSARLSRRG